MARKPSTVEPAAPELMELRFPGPAFRPVPSFTIGVPPEWVITEFPDALFAMGPHASAAGFWTNVIVRHERVLPNVALEELARATWENLEVDFPNAVITDERLVGMERLHYVREVELWGSEEEPVTRIDSFVFGPVIDAPTVDLFQFTWLHPTAAGDTRKLLYIDILSSFHFEE